MIQLKIKTEFSLRKAYGHVSKVVEACEGNAVAITDNGTWGYVKFYHACKAANKKPIFGLTLDIVPDGSKIRYGAPEVTILAKNLEGLKTIYRLASLSWERKYYTNRIYYSDLDDCDNIEIIMGQGCNIEKLKNLQSVWIGITPNSSEYWVNQAREYTSIPKVITSDNAYINADDEEVYEVFISDFKKTNAKFILNEEEMKAHLPYWEQDWFDVSNKIAEEIEEFDLPIAENVKFSSEKTLEQMCREGASERGLVWTDEYETRLVRELAVIEEKKFEDYFFVIADLIRFAKTKMLVGPGRGSSAGSLVCYLLNITEIDPIPYGLIFERFVSLNRDDLPDIDIDFPDTKRAQVIKYLENKYGKPCVASIGTISQYKARSILGELGKKASIPFEKMEALKNDVGDSIALSTNHAVYKQMLEEYPGIALAPKIEGHARHSGKHAAGIIVLNDSIKNYCSLFEGNVAQIDKKDAEYINILKIDVLGLRTLSVIDHCLKQINMSHKKLLGIPMEQKAFDVINAGNVSGIFQFEGDTIRNLSKKISIDKFDDLIALTTIARPGALISGGADLFINRRNGEAYEYINNAIEQETSETFGVIIYQEQVMAIARNLGELSWEDVSEMRKLMSKTKDIDHFMGKFVSGAKKSITEKEAKFIWEYLKAFGSYGFNKSHAVCYALISYWCAWLKAHYPLEFAVSCLINSASESQTTKILRELVNEGFEYKALDKEFSQANWSIQKGVLVGGLMGIKGVGVKAAADIIKRRKTGEPLLPGQQTKMDNPDIYYEDVFECRTKYGGYYTHPEKHGVNSGIPVSYIRDIDGEGDFIFIGKLVEKDLKNLNDYESFKDDGDNPLFLNMVLEDDTDDIKCTISRWSFEQYGRAISDGKTGGYHLVRGRLAKNYRKIYIDNIKKI